MYMLGILFSVMIKIELMSSKLYSTSKIVFNDTITLLSHYKSNLLRRNKWYSGKTTRIRVEDFFLKFKYTDSQETLFQILLLPPTKVINPSNLLTLNFPYL